jgi:acyl-coenzyme A synthetase/AMP-(fatty) acid ligase
VTVLALPKEIEAVKALPVIGSGKIDYVTLAEIANGAAKAA